MTSNRQLEIRNVWQSTDENILINAVAGSGKEQPIWCKVQTPNGPVEIGSLKMGDTILGSDGKTQRVSRVYPQGIKDYYKVTFRDGLYTYCGLEHLWTVNNAGNKNNSLKTMALSEILERGLKKQGGDLKFRIPLCAPVEYPKIETEIDPYIMGLLIGDGSLTTNTPCLSFNADDLEIVNESIRLLPNVEFNLRSTSENGLQTTLVPNNKEYLNSENWIKTYLNNLKLCVYSKDRFIPSVYLRNSIEDRKKLLQGLMDSDGSCTNNRTSFSSTSIKLILDVIELVNSLGGTAIQNSPDIREDKTTSYRLNIKTFFCPFNVSKKKNSWKLSLKNGPSRYISNIEKIGSCEQVCIKVSNEDQLYLTDNFIVTHNTTTLLMLLELCEYRTLFLAFNKSIQEEIQSKMDERGLAQGKAMTLHSLGLSAIRNGYRKFRINNNKNWDILKMFKERYKKMFKTMHWNEIIRLSYALIDMNDISRMYLTNDYNEIKEHFLTMDKNLPDSEYLEEFWQTFMEIRDESYEQSTVEIDFNDMIYLPVIKNLEIPVKSYYLMIDECQDLNLCQHTLVDNLIAQGDIHKWIAVGDRNQSIYGFSGAHSNSFDLFKEKENVVELPLDICYRCTTAIIDKANEVYPVMEYHKTQPGIVSTTSNIAGIKENSMVICRNTGPIIALYFKLLALNKNCYIKGEDILNRVMRFMKPYNSLTIGAATKEMDYKLEDLAGNHSDEGKMKYYIFQEDYGNFKSIVQHMCKEYESVDSFLNKLKSLFIDKENAIVLCTIHKSKGLEADVVYILNEHLIPSKFAKSKEQLTQERNLKYVARTRAKEEMYFLNI